MHILTFLFGPDPADLAKLFWQPVEATMNAYRFGCTSAVVEDELFVLGGYTDTRATLSSVEAYNMEDKRWRTIPQMQTARAGCTAASIESGILAIGGWNGCCLDSVEMLDLKTNTWFTFPSMKTKRSGCCAGAIGRYVIVAGGHDGDRRLSSAELFDPVTQQWVDLPDMKYARLAGAMAVVRTKAYIFGGHNQNTTEVFDLETRQWTTLPPMSINRWGFATAVVGRIILVVGGGSDVVEAFDIDSQTWSELRNLPSARRFCVCGFVGNQVLVAGGIESHGKRPNSDLLLDVDDPPNSLIWPKIPNALDLGYQEYRAELETWVSQVTTMKQESLARIETVAASDNKNKRMEKQVLEVEYTTEKATLEAMHENNKERLWIDFETEKVVLEREMEGKMKERDLFLKFAKKRKQAIKTKCKMKIVALEAEYGTNLTTLEMNHATSLSALDTKYATKHSALDARYKKKQEITERATEYWESEIMEELMEDIKDQIKLLELHLGGGSSASDGNQSNEGRHCITSLVLCPISGKIMVDPVMAADGYTYERSEIEGHFAKTPLCGHDMISPVTGKPLTHSRLAPNESVKAVASQYT
eukprot:CAMPEP_0116851096 /NCGR_PEP_ID=MMETSP0418-20121206/16522_1 /TAXON_ID=1158023 /ORGANISM="Astrosyne radiata, Strain 13vi08-1A" /LENGTH=587 /DNA_ID=CAMNT_0004483059 /DNA_START=1 /DNA_END=1764 /DNA_ORIENTATION=+